MAQYKVIQDVEAEDKILGPFTLKQLIFAVLSAGITFAGLRAMMFFGSVLAIIPFLPFVIAFGALAAPLSKNQPTEIWLAAQIHFFTKPKKRLWNQNGLKHLVNITVPPKVLRNYTDGLSQGQVKSRLSALASTLDSRGWAVKNINSPTSVTNLYLNTPNSERLLTPQQPIAVAQEDPPNADVLGDTDKLKEFSKMIEQSDEAHKKQIYETMQKIIAKQKTSTPQQPINHTILAPQNYVVNTPNVVVANNILNPNNQPSNNQPAVTNNTISPEEAAYMYKLKAAALAAKTPPNPHHKVVKTPQDLAEQVNTVQTQATQTPEPTQTVAKQTTKDNPDTIKKAYAKKPSHNNDNEVEIFIDHN